MRFTTILLLGASTALAVYWWSIFSAGVPCVIGGPDAYDQAAQQDMERLQRIEDWAKDEWLFCAATVDYAKFTGGHEECFEASVKATGTLMKLGAAAGVTYEAGHQLQTTRNESFGLNGTLSGDPSVCRNRENVRAMEWWTYNERHINRFTEDARVLMADQKEKCEAMFAGMNRSK